MAGDGYTILGRAAEIAEATGRDQADVEGELVERHQYRIWQVIEQRKTKRAALKAKAAKLQAMLDLAQWEQRDCERGIMDETLHDRAVLAQYVAEAPQFADARSKTQQFAWGEIRTATRTRPAQITAIDREALAAMYPEHTTPALQWGSLKARLRVVGDRVVDNNGVVLPEGLVLVSEARTQTTTTTTIEGLKLDLTGGVLTDGNGSDGPDDADSDDTGDVPVTFAGIDAAEDPFGD
jgi:hypothetical protein